MNLIKNRRGMSPIISSVILSAVVIAIGASVWSVTDSAASVMQNDYYEGVMESVENIKERFYIENIGYSNSSEPKLKIWIYNYGEMDIVIELIRLKGAGNISTQLIGTPLSVREIIGIDVTSSEFSLTSGLSVSIEVKSLRGNKAYASILIP
jgi:hypothetical protein